MLKRDRDVALQDVIVSLRSAAEQYERDSESIGDSELGTPLRKLAKKRAQLAADLETQMRQKGLMPQSPDPDRETIATVVRHVKAALSSEERASLLADYQRIEQAVIEAAKKALELQEDHEEEYLQKSIEECKETLEWIHKKFDKMQKNRTIF